MKRVVLACMMMIVSRQAIAQANLVIEAPKNNNSTSAARAPNGTTAHAYMRGCFLVLATELTNIPSSTTLTSFGYTLNSGTSGNAVTGNYTLYLENTSNTSYSKGTTWSTAIGGMTQVYANVMTIPASAGTTSVMVTLSTPFVYTGGGLYVAYDWASGSPYSTTAAVYLCESAALTTGGASEASASAPPSTLTATNFRPSFLFGFANPYSNDMHVTGVSAPGRIPAIFNTPHQVTAMVMNGSSVTLSGVSVSLTVSGANSFNDVQTVSSLGAGASTLITFSAFNPLTAGLNTIVVSVPTDQNTFNNSLSYSQSVTCSEWSQQPATGSFTSLSVGFNTGSGIIGVQYLNPVTSTLNAIRVAISSNTPTIGKSMYAALLSATGATLAVTNPITITSAMLGTYVQFNFPFPPVLNANTTYYLGGAQTVGSVGYHPFGSQSSNYMPPNLYAYTGLAGGALTQLTQNFGYFGLTGVFSSTIALSVTPQTVACGTSGTLQASSSTNYSWSTGATTSSIVISPTISTIYTVIATNTMGCVASKTVMLGITPLPVTAAASVDTLCLGKTVTLTASGASSYFWSAGGGGATVNHSPLQTTVYTVTGSIPVGCATTATVSVAVRNFSTLVIPVSSKTICLGSPVTLTASGASSYTWTDGSFSGNGPVLTHSPDVTTIYTVTGADNLGCVMSKTVEASVIIVPLTLSRDTAVCSGSALTLTAGGASSFNWNGTIPFQNLIINSVTVAATHTVTGTGMLGCKQQGTVNVSVLANPTITAKATRSVMCVKESNVIKADGGVTYSWSTGSKNPSVTITPTINLPQNLKVIGFNANGCKSEATVSVIVSLCLGLEEATTQPILVFPNPGNGIFYVESGFSGKALVTITDITGAIIRSFETDKSRFEVDLSAHAQGIYFLDYTNGQERHTVRLIRQ